MPQEIIYLDEDTTAKNPSNLIQGEVWSPPAAKWRMIVPHWGAFYLQDLALVDADSGDPVGPEHYQMGDVFPIGQERSGKSVFTCFVLKQSAPASVAVTYRAYGGPQSRNAKKILDVLKQRMQENTGTINYSDLTDLPKEWNVEWHNHLLAHVYGMEYIDEALKRLDKIIGTTDHHEILEGQYQRALVRLDDVQNSAFITVEALVTDYWKSWEQQMSLFNLGVDLLRNYPTLGDSGVLAAKPTFAIPNSEDNRYVDLRGLGSFSKALVERVVTRETGLGMEHAIEKTAQRGSLIGATVGETFMLPSPKAARDYLYVNMQVYPPGYNANDPMVVVKLMANHNDYGGVFSAFNPNTGDQWVGIILNEIWSSALVWNRVYYDDQATPVAEAIKTHIDARGAVHSETKEQLGLGHVPNMPVVDLDNIVTGESKKMLLTYDTLMAYWRVNMEKIKLTRKENGEVDYDADLLNENTRVIINSGSCGAEHPPKGQFMSSFCDGTDKYTRMTDGNGSYYDTLTEANSDDCGYNSKPPYGTKLGEFCQGDDQLARYSDGLGGSYTEVMRRNSPDCGFVAPPPQGSVLAVFCSGTNQMTRYADGKGSTYDMPTMIDTYLCGGKIYASTGTGTGGNNGGGTPSTPGTPSLKFGSTHDKITPNTFEIISFYAENLTPATRYTFEIMSSSPTVSSGVPFILDTGAFVTDAKGNFLWEQSRTDDGLTTARGVYQTWAKIASANLESNKVTRNFISGDTPTKPIDTTNPGGGGSGSGGDAVLGPGPDINGNPYDPNGPWPPVPKYNPKITFSSDRSTLYVGTNETMTLALEKFMADTNYSVDIYTKHPKLQNGVPIKTLTIKLETNAAGYATYRISNLDDGTVPRGTTTDWAECIDTKNTTIKSNEFNRVFAEGTESQSKYRALSIVSSHDTVYIGTAYTQSIVLTGATPNTRYSLELRRSRESGLTSENGVLVNTFVVTTNGTGTARYDFTAQYDGVLPQAGYYTFFARLTGIEQMSTLSNVTFVAKPADQTGRGILTFNSTHTSIKKGTVETMTATITNGTPSKVVKIEHWNQGPNLNAGQPLFTHTTSMSIGSNGIGVSEITVTDDGTSVPRGEYQTWVACSELNLVSRKITRTFLNEDGTTGTPKPTLMTVSYVTTHSTISPGVNETHVVSVTNAKASSVVFADLWVSSPALNNGNTPLKTKTLSISTNSQGTGSASFTNTDDGVSAPRGAYLCWAQVDDVKSPTITRTFIGTPPPTVPYNPQVAYSVNYTTISPGQEDTHTIRMTGFKPVTSYTLEWWMRGVNAFNGNDFMSLRRTVVTDNNGAVTSSTTSTDDGHTIPRGTYSNWGYVAETGTRSNTVTRTFIGTPAPTEPPYSPQVRYYTSLYEVRPGIQETHTVALHGMRPNRSYAVDIYIQSPALYNGQVFYSTTVNITTNSTGSGSYIFYTTDSGTIVPRGTYANWAVIKETGTTSSVFTRVFVS